MYRAWLRLLRGEDRPLAVGLMAPDACVAEGGANRGEFVVQRQSVFIMEDGAAHEQCGGYLEHGHGPAPLLLPRNDVAHCLRRSGERPAWDLGIMPGVLAQVAELELSLNLHSASLELICIGGEDRECVACDGNGARAQELTRAGTRSTTDVEGGFPEQIAQRADCRGEQLAAAGNGGALAQFVAAHKGAVFVVVSDGRMCYRVGRPPLLEVVA